MCRPNRIDCDTDRGPYRKGRDQHESLEEARWQYHGVVSLYQAHILFLKEMRAPHQVTAGRFYTNSAQ